MSHAERARQKRELFATLLQDGIAGLHFDPRAPGVEVPARFAGQSQLLLNFSYRYRLTDFDFDDEVVQATLSFGGQPYFCRIPWYAVFAVANEARDKGRVWETDAPPELGGPERSWPPLPPARTPVAKGKPKLRVLRAVEDGDAPSEPASVTPEPDAAPEPEPPSDRRPSIRRLGIAPAQPAAPAVETAPSAAVSPSDSPDEPPPPPPARPGSHLRRIK